MEDGLRPVATAPKSSGCSSRTKDLDKSRAAAATRKEKSAKRLPSRALRRSASVNLVNRQGTRRIGSVVALDGFAKEPG